MEDSDLNLLRCYLDLADLVERSQTLGMITPQQRELYDQILSQKVVEEIVRLGSL